MTDDEIRELFDRNPNLLMAEIVTITDRTPKEIKDILLTPTKTDPEILAPSDFITAAEIFHYYAPGFSFELDQEALVLEALKRGFVTMVGVDQYLINQNYQGVESDD